MGDLDCMTRRLAAASVAAGLALCLVPAGASAFPVLAPDATALEAPAPVATTAAKKRKKINKKVKVTGKFSVLPGSTFGTMAMTPDGVAHLKGARIVGRLNGRMLGGKKARRGLPRGLARLLKIDVSGKLDIDAYYDPAHHNPLVARGLVAGRSTKAKKVTGCIKFSTTNKNGQPVQKFRLLGGTGKAAGYTMSGRLPTFSLDLPADQRPTSLTLRVKSAKKKRPTKSCRRLLKQLKKKR